jgi:uncharacterized membrane protein
MDIIMQKAVTRGIVNLLPLALSLWLFWSIMVALENIGSTLLGLVGITSPWNGAGFVVVFGLLLTAGLAFSVSPVLWIFHKLEAQLLKFPLFKPVYSSIKDMASLVIRDAKKPAQRQTVLVKQANGTFVVGFITANNLPSSVEQTLKAETEHDDWVPVLMQLSYQVAGVTTLVRQADLTPVDWPFEDAMRFMLTAGISQGESASKKATSNAQ